MPGPSRPRAFGLPALRTCVAALAVALVGCGVPQERSVLEQFFAAARLRDNTALSRIATTTFEPLESGIVVDFEIQAITVESANRKEVAIRAPVRLRDGRVVEKRLTVLLQRGAIGTDADSARRWIVIEIKESS